MIEANEICGDPFLKRIVELVMWRDESTTKKKARAIQKVIDKRCATLDCDYMEFLETRLKKYGYIVSAW